MSLIKCLECNKEYSDKAESCPNCGCPTTININDLSITDDFQNRKESAEIANNYQEKSSEVDEVLAEKLSHNEKITSPALQGNEGILINNDMEISNGSFQDNKSSKMKLSKTGDKVDIDGWLYLPFFHLVLLTVSLLFDIFQSVISYDYFADDVLIIVVLIDTILLSLVALTYYNARKRKTRTKTFFILLYSSQVILGIIGGDYTALIIILWIVYMLNSKRVKATFTE
jgi:RNA polymerase subunit RPABC4/transcription elongation factor Spt4